MWKCFTSCRLKAKRCIERKFVGYIPIPAFTKGASKSKVVLEKREVRKLTVISFSEDSTKFELAARNGNLTHSTATFCPDDCQRLYRLALDIHRRGLKTHHSTVRDYLIQRGYSLQKASWVSAHYQHLIESSEGCRAKCPAPQLVVDLSYPFSFLLGKPSLPRNCGSRVSSACFCPPATLHV